MPHDGGRLIAEADTGLDRADTPIGILAIGEEGLVEEADFPDNVCSDEHGATG